MVGGACSSHAAAVSAGPVIAPRRPVASAGLPARGRLPGRIRPACPGSRPASASAWRSRNSIWAFVLRSSSSAHLARGVMNGRIQLSLSVAGRTVGM